MYILIQSAKQKTKTTKTKHWYYQKRIWPHRTSKLILLLFCRIRCTIDHIRIGKSEELICNVRNMSVMKPYTKTACGKVATIEYSIVNTCRFKFTIELLYNFRLTSHCHKSVDALHVWNYYKASNAKILSNTIQGQHSWVVYSCRTVALMLCFVTMEIRIWPV